MAKFDRKTIQDHVWRNVHGNEVVEDAANREDVLTNPGAYLDHVIQSGQRLAIRDQQGECTHVLLSADEYQALQNLTAEIPEVLISSLRVSPHGDIRPEDHENAVRHLADEVDARREQQQRQGNEPDGPLVMVCSPPHGGVLLPADLSFLALVLLYAMVRAEVAKNLFR